MIHLADGNLLIAIAIAEHVHHERAIGWFAETEPELATCPVTQGTLLRFLLHAGQSASEAAGLLDEIARQPWHHFWADDVPYGKAMLRGVIGHRQVTDAYLVALADHRSGRLVTLDRGLAALHGGRVLLLDA